MSRKKYQIYSKEFKLEAIRLAEESDKPVTQVARELGLRVNQIYKWKKQLEEKQDAAFSAKRGRMPNGQTRIRIQWGQTRLK